LAAAALMSSTRAKDLGEEAAAHERAIQFVVAQQLVEVQRKTEQAMRCKVGHPLVPYGPAPATAPPPQYSSGWLRCDVCGVTQEIARMRGPFFHCHVPTCNEFDVCPNCVAHLSEQFVLQDGKVVLVPNSTAMAGSVGASKVSTVLWHDPNAPYVKLDAGTGALKRTEDPQHAFGFYTGVAHAKLHDAFSYEFEMAAGTYTMAVMGVRGASSGSVQWSLDGRVLNKDAQDWYARGTVRNELVGISGINVADGNHVLRANIVGKNAASAGFELNITRVQFLAQ
jgi:hypothetical protein